MHRTARPARGVEEQREAGLVAVTIVAGALFVWPRRPSFPRVARPLALALRASAFLVAILAVAGVDERFARGRYRSDPIAAAVSAAQPQRIAIGGFDQQYPLYGDRLQNRVQYIGEHLPHGGFLEVSSCERWRDLVRQENATYVAVADPAPATGPPTEWATSWPGATEVVRARGLVLLELRELDAGTRCR